MTSNGITKAAICCRGVSIKDGAREERLKTHDGASDADSDGQLHLVLHGHPNGGYMLSGVSDEGQQDQTDERLGDAVSLGSLFDRSDD